MPNGNIGNNPLSLVPIIIIDILLISILLQFYSLKITLTDEIVKNPWYYGSGIKIVSNGMLYSVHGLNAIELTFKNEQKIIRIGSPECNKLKIKIEKRLIKKE